MLKRSLNLRPLILLGHAEPAIEFKYRQEPSFDIKQAIPAGATTEIPKDAPKHVIDTIGINTTAPRGIEQNVLFYDMAKGNFDSVRPSRPFAKEIPSELLVNKLDWSNMTQETLDEWYYSVRSAIKGKDKDLGLKFEAYEHGHDPDCHAHYHPPSESGEWETLRYNQSFFAASHDPVHAATPQLQKRNLFAYSLAGLGGLLFVGFLPGFVLGFAGKSR